MHRSWSIQASSYFFSCFPKVLTKHCRYLSVSAFPFHLLAQNILTAVLFPHRPTVRKIPGYASLLRLDQPTPTRRRALCCCVTLRPRQPSSSSLLWRRRATELLFWRSVILTTLWSADVSRRGNLSWFFLFSRLSSPSSPTGQTGSSYFHASSTFLLAEMCMEECDPTSEISLNQSGNYIKIN